jgi:hypothetical protein
MGLSEFRGGNYGLAKSGGMGAGKARKALAVKSMNDAHQMGHALGRHIFGLHGGAFHKDFCEGMLKGGGIWDSISGAFQKVGNEFTNPNSVLRSQYVPKVENEFTDPNSVLRGKVIPIGSKVASVAEPFIDAAVPGLGTAINTGFKAANYANQGANALGYGKTGAYEGKGRKKKRAPASAGDGRRKRAEIVKKVMAEKGMKMIDASKYVKEHGLY